MNDTKNVSSSGSAAPLFRIGTLIVGLIVGIGIGVTYLKKDNVKACVTACTDTTGTLINALVANNYMREPVAENLLKQTDGICNRSCSHPDSK